MKPEDAMKVGDLEQQTKETRYLIAQNVQDTKEARAAVAPLQNHFSNGLPGARIELEAARKKLSDLEASGANLEARLLTLTQERAAFTAWESGAVSLAREFSLSDAQKEALYDALKSGTERPKVRNIAAGMAREKSNGAERLYSFNPLDGVAW